MLSLFILIPLCCVMFGRVIFRGLLKGMNLWLGLFLCATQVLLTVFPAQWFWDSKVDLFRGLFNFTLAADSMSRVALLCVGIVVFVVLLAVRTLIQEERKRNNFMDVLCVAFIGMNAIALVRDIFSLYVFMEITAVASFILIALDNERDAFEGAFKYVIFSAIATVLMLSAIGLLLFISGGTSFSEIREGLKLSSHNFLIFFAIGIFLTGLFIKSGLAPFHGWVMDAYSSAPSLTSVLLGGILTKATGMYALMRLVDSVFILESPIKSILMLVGIFSIVMGAIAALSQDDFKRMLSYSSISQMGYIVLGLGCGTSLGMLGALFHFFNHAIFKSLLFVNSASLESQAGTRNISRMSGLAKKMPFTAISSLIAGLSTAGIPPLAGFWSKFIIIVALWTSGYYVYAIIAILASVLTLGYILFMQRKIFWGSLKPGFETVKEAGSGLVLGELILAAIIVAVGVLFPIMMR